MPELDNVLTLTGLVCKGGEIIIHEEKRTTIAEFFKEKLTVNKLGKLVYNLVFVAVVALSPVDYNAVVAPALKLFLDAPEVVGKCFVKALIRKNDLLFIDRLF